MSGALRRLGFGLLATGALLALATSVLAPFPTSAFALEAKLQKEGTIDAERVLLAAGVAYLHAYDEANDTTYFRVAMCSHSLCGPALAVRGDHREGLDAPLLLRPTGDTLSLVPAPPVDAAGNTSYFQRRDTDVAYSLPFEPRSPWPPFLPRLAALALVGAGIALAARPRWPSIVAPLAGSGMGLLVARGPSFIILSQLFVLPLALAALIAAAVGMSRKKSAWGAGAVALLLVVELAAGFLAFAHFAPDGGD